MCAKAKNTLGISVAYLRILINFQTTFFLEILYLWHLHTVHQKSCDRVFYEGQDPDLFPDIRIRIRNAGSQSRTAPLGGETIGGGGLSLRIESARKIPFRVLNSSSRT
jgi:hypothetical protein